MELSKEKDRNCCHSGSPLTGLLFLMAGTAYFLIQSRTVQK